MKEMERFLLIGFDEASLDYVKSLVAGGHLSNFAGFIKNGCTGTASTLYSKEQETIREIEMTTLDIGCGSLKHRDSIGIDLKKLKGVDIIADASFLPIRDDSCGRIFLRHIVEHVVDLVKLMTEIWRVSQNYATVRIWTPHFSYYGSYRDLTHTHHLTSESFDYFDRRTLLGKQFWFRKKVCFEVRKKRIKFIKDKKRFWNYLMEKIANRNRFFYESHITWIFPAHELYFELETCKNTNHTVELADI